jgi:arylsulfatase A-like enzyme
MIPLSMSLYLFLFPWLLSQLNGSEADRLPNFILILADDLGCGDLGAYGHPTIKTPNLDRMTAEGVRLTSFYMASSTCTPSRAALLTGRYPIRSGLIRVLHSREKFGIPDSEITLAEALKERGYATACVGKWHLGDLPPYRPNRHGFDFYYGLLYSNDMTFAPPNFSRLILYRNDEPIETPVKQSTLTRRYTEQAIAFIQNHKEQPFFLYLAHTMPHVPLHASQEFVGRSRAGLYGDVVEEIDWSVGKILETLKKTGLDANTLVIFTSDNGPALQKAGKGGSAGLLRGGKHTTWEGGVRVPCIARWPGRIPANIVQSKPAAAMDIFPTLIHLAGGNVPSDRPVDGKDFMGMLEGKDESPHSILYFYDGAQIFAVRSEGWKLHLLKREAGPIGVSTVKECKPPELYNLLQDPAESENVAKDHPEVIAWLTARIREFHEGTKPGKIPPRWPSLFKR